VGHRASAVVSWPACCALRFIPRSLIGRIAVFLAAGQALEHAGIVSGAHFSVHVAFKIAGGSGRWGDRGGGGGCRRCGGRGGTRRGRGCWRGHALDIATGDVGRVGEHATLTTDLHAEGVDIVCKRKRLEQQESSKREQQERAERCREMQRDAANAANADNAENAANAANAANAHLLGPPLQPVPSPGVESVAHLAVPFCERAMRM
jgi:hypothetical protein